MSEEKNDSNRSYNADDIRRYLANEMPATERHALERAALEDPMLDDALEGMKTTRQDTREDLDLIIRRLAERNAEKNRVIPVWGLPAKIAASVALLIGLAGVGYFLKIKSGAPKDIALSGGKTTSPVSPGSAADTTPAASQPASTAPQPETTAGSPAPAATNDKAAYDAKPRTAESNPSEPPAAVRARAGKRAVAPGSESPAAESREAEEKNDDALNNGPEKKKSISADNEAGSPATAAAPKARRENRSDSAVDDAIASGSVPPISKDKAAASVPETLEGKAAGVVVASRINRRAKTGEFSGQVSDEKGQAIAGVTIKMGKAITTTDIQGRFLLPSADSDSDPIDFSSPGYIPLTLIPDLQRRSTIAISLSPAAIALNEVAVTGYGSRKKPAAAGTTPTPAPGWKNYRNYLGATMMQSTIDSSLHGTEKISFSLTPDGEPVDFVIDHSLSSQHDSVTVRIIRNGPKWKPAKDSARRVSMALPY